MNNDSPRETIPVMNNAAASVSTSTGGLLSLTEPTMEIRNREGPKRRDQPPCSIPPTGRGHPGVCVEPLRPDDGGCVMPTAEAGSTPTAPLPLTTPPSPLVPSTSIPVGHTRFSWLPQGVVPPGHTAFSWGHGPTPPPTRTELKFGKRVWSGWFRTAQELIPDRDEDRRKACPIFKAGARGYQLGLKGASWLPEMWQRVADLFQDDRYGARLLPFLDIEIRRIIPAHDVVHDEGQWLRHVCLCFEPRPEGVPDPDYRRLHQHLFHSDAYAYIVVMTSQGPYPFLLRACEGKNNNWRMIAGKVPVLRGDPCVHCPGWGQAWDAKHRRPYWFHWAHGPTWVRPVGWRGTDYPFPIIVLRHHFCDWW